MCVYLYHGAQMEVRGQPASQRSPSTMLVLGTELRLSGVAAGALNLSHPLALVKWLKYRRTNIISVTREL